MRIRLVAEPKVLNDLPIALHVVALHVVQQAATAPNHLQQALKLGAISFLIKAPTAGPLIDLVRKFLPSNPAKSPAQLH